MGTNTYGINVTNRYALFLDQDEGDLANNVVPDPKATNNAIGGKPGAKLAGATSASKPSQKSPAGALSESKVNVAANQKDSGLQNRPRSGNQNQRSNRGDQENRTNRSPRTNNAFGQRPFGEGKGEDGEIRDAGRDMRDGKDGRRNGYAGGRGARRGGGGFGPGQGGGRMGGKRDFNRHSGSDKTGIKATDKRDGAGAHNWGKPTDDFSAAPEEELVNGEQPNVEAAPETTDGEADQREEKTGTDAEEPKNDEPQLKTLDEYKREREEKRMHTQFNTRKANEGEDKTKWKKTYVLQKKALADEEEVEYEEIEVEEDSNKRRGRQILDIEVNFRPSEDGRDFVRRGRGGPGGRGRGGFNDRRPPGPQSGGENARTPRPGGNERGAPGGRSNRGGRDRQGGRFQAAPKFDDLNDFPSL